MTKREKIQNQLKKWTEAGNEILVNVYQTQLDELDAGIEKSLKIEKVEHVVDTEEIKYWKNQTSQILKSLDSHFGK